MAIDSIQKIVEHASAGRKDLVQLGPNRFDKLVLALKKALGPSSGLTSEDVDVGHLTRLMEEYTTAEPEWSGFAMGDESRGYTRNLVDEGNGKSNLVSVDTSDPEGPAVG